MAMDEQIESRHISEDELAQLVLDELPLFREEVVLSHIAACDSCAELSRWLHEVAETLDEMAPASAALRRIAGAALSLMSWGPRMTELVRDLAAVALGG